jgi:hypothetical protein
LRFRYDLDSEVGVTRIYIAHGARALARSAASLTSAYLAKIADGVRGRRRTALLARRSDLR